MKGIIQVEHLGISPHLDSEVGSTLYLGAMFRALRSPVGESQFLELALPLILASATNNKLKVPLIIVNFCRLVTH